VQNYFIRANRHRAAHGDWLKDEVDARPRDTLRHNVTLAHGSFEIEAEQIDYKWTPFPASGK
jgi:hypothetical protein